MRFVCQVPDNSHISQWSEVSGHIPMNGILRQTFWSELPIIQSDTDKIGLATLNDLVVFSVEVEVEVSRLSFKLFVWMFNQFDLIKINLISSDLMNSILEI